LLPQAPSIIFIDEIDAIGRKRGKGGFTGGLAGTTGDVVFRVTFLESSEWLVTGWWFWDVPSGNLT